MGLSKKEIAEFEKWCADTTPIEGAEVTAINFNNLSKLDTIINENYNIKYIVINAPKDIEVNDKYIGDVALSYGETHKISNCKINKLTVNCACKLEIKNTHIKLFIINANAFCDVVLSNCIVGTLQLNASSLNMFYCIGGTIRKFIVAAPGISPFYGGNIFIDSNVAIPTSTKKSNLYVGPQAFCSLRHHFEQLENMPMAALMRSLELRSQRDNEPWLLRVISYFNGWVSDYGRRPERALLLLFAVFALTVGALTYFSLTATGFDESGHAFTHTVENLPARMAGDKWIAHFRRATTLALQALNPFSLFDAKRVIVPATQGATIGLFFHSLISDALLAVIAFAVRRRFKLSA